MDMTALLVIKLQNMKDLMNDIKSNRFRKVYLLYGPENYLKHLWRDRLLKALMPSADPMNLTSLSGESVTEGSVIDQAETLPFFADRRVISLSGTGFFSRGTELLPDYLRELPDYLVLVFTEDEVDKRNRLFKAVQKYGHAAEFAEQGESALTAFILQNLTENHLKIRKSNMEFLLGRTGTDMTRIRLEVDKLIHYCAECGEEEVTADAIRRVTVSLTENRIFDMIQAVTEHRLRDAMELYADLLTLRESPMRILSLIGRQYRQLLALKELSKEGMTQQQMASSLSMHPFAVKKSLPLTKRYTPQQLLDACSYCAELEEDVKSGRLSDRLSVELVMIRLSRS